MNTIKNINLISEKLHIGNVSKFYTAKLKYNGVNFHITYDCLTENLILHEWYKLDESQLSSLTEELKKHFQNKAT